jgi:hypothetical protein
LLTTFVSKSYTDSYAKLHVLTAPYAENVFTDNFALQHQASQKGT